MAINNSEFFRFVEIVRQTDYDFDKSFILVRALKNVPAATAKRFKERFGPGGEKYMEGRTFAERAWKYFVHCVKQEDEGGENVF